MMNMGVKKTINDRVLIVSDSAEEVDAIQHLLTVDFGRLLKTKSESDGLSLFKKHHPPVLVLAFETIEKSKDFYLSLYRYDSQIHELSHYTLLLCKGAESDKAYQLYRSGLIDDYVADRPLYDPYCLRLSVAQALDRSSQEQSARLLNDRIGKITDGLQQFDRFFSSKLASGDGQHQEAIRTFQHFTQNLATELKLLEKNLIGDASGESLQVMDKETLSHQFAHIRNDSLERGSQDVVDQLNKTGNWLEEINNGYKSHYVETIQKESEAIRTKQIMLVDDDEFYLDILTTMLQEAGMQVVGIGDSRQALTQLRQDKPKLILLDYKMPGMDGIETLKQIKSNPDTRSIPVIMLTGVSAREIVDQCLRAGAVDFIVKPSDSITILSKIDKAMKR